MILKRQTLFLSLSLSLILLTEIQYKLCPCHPSNIFAVLLRRGELELNSCELTFIRRCDLCIYAGIILIETEKCEHTRTNASNFSQINYLRIWDIHFSCKFLNAFNFGTVLILHYWLNAKILNLLESVEIHFLP